jgi:hypothetical protein
MKSSSGAPRDGAGDEAGGAGGTGAGGVAIAAPHQATLTNSQYLPRID